MLFPEKRNFITNKENGTMVAIYSTLKEDLYVVFAGIDPETQMPVIHAFLNPLVKWIWFGGVVVVFGTLVALLPNRRSVLVLAGAPQPVQPLPILATEPPDHRVSRSKRQGRQQKKGGRAHRDKWTLRDIARNRV